MTGIKTLVDFKCQCIISCQKWKLSGIACGYLVFMEYVPLFTAYVYGAS